MHLKSNTRRIETPGHIVPIQELQEVPLYNPDQIVAATSPAQTTIPCITTPAIHQEVIPEETALAHMEVVPQRVLVVVVAVVADVLSVQVPDIENKFVESIFRI